LFNIKSCEMKKHTFILMAVMFMSVVLTGQQVVKELYSGQQLRVGERLYSAYDGYYLTLQYDGNLCIYKSDNNAFVWCSMVTGFDASSLVLQNDGNLVIYDRYNVAKWSSQTHPYFDSYFSNSSNKPERLILDRNGILNLLSNSGRTVWTNVPVNQTVAPKNNYTPPSNYTTAPPNNSNNKKATVSITSTPTTTSVTNNAIGNVAPVNGHVFSQNRKSNISKAALSSDEPGKYTHTEAMNVCKKKGARLPTKDELNQMYLKLHKKGKGNFLSEGYWAQEVDSDGWAYRQKFSSGSSDSRPASGNKHVRCIAEYYENNYSVGDQYEGGLIYYIDTRTNIKKIALMSDESGKYSHQEASNVCKNKGARLPTKDELNQMYLQLHKKGKGNFLREGYWAQEVDSDGWAWRQKFSSGSSDSRPASGSKHVRCVLNKY
jgi:hypothetical protein